MEITTKNKGNYYETVIMISVRQSIRATAFICDDEDKMWRQAGFVEMLVSPAKRDQNEMGGLQKRGRFRTRLKRGRS